MANFELAHQKVSQLEGGYALNPADMGGETVYGISRKFHPNWWGWRFVDQAKDTMVRMPPFGASGYYSWVKHLDGKLNAIPALQALVVEFYRKNFWDCNRLGDIKNQEVATWVYSAAVNAGSTGVKWAQTAAGASADGIVGNKTIAAINAAEPKELIDRMKQEALKHRLKVVSERPSQAIFLKGWLRRDGFTDEEIKEYDT